MERAGTRKIEILIFVAVALVAITVLILARMYWSFADVRDNPIAPESAATSDLRQAGSVTEPNREVEPASSTRSDLDVASAGVKPSKGPTPEEVAAQKGWEYEHGYRYNDRSMYISLSDAELLQLAAGGDISAMQFLAARSIVDNPLKAIEQYEQAAAMGSTYALIAVADLLRLHDSQEANLIADGDSAAIGFSALKYTYAAELRGNNIASGIKRAEILAEYDFSEQQIRRACEEARRLVLELDRQRIQRTGRAFDNSESPFGTPISQLDQGACRRSS